MLKRQIQGQCCAFPRCAFDLDRSFVALDDIFHVAQTQTKSLHVVHVSGGDTIQPFKDLAKMFFGDAHAVVLDGQRESSLALTRSNDDVWILASILHGIVDEVEHDVGQMDAVALEVGVGSFQVQFNFRPLFVELHGHVFHHALHQIVHVQWLGVQAHGARFGKTRPQHIFHQHPEPFVLLSDQPQVMLLRFAVKRRVRHRFGGESYAGNGRFQLMGQIVHQIPLQPVQSLGPLDGHEGVTEHPCDQKHHPHAQGESSKHLTHEVPRQPREVDAQLKGAEGHRIPLSEQHVPEGLGLFGQEDGLAVTVEGSKNRLRLDALLQQG